MGMEMEGSILAPTLFVIKLHVALARMPGRIAFGSGGRVEDFSCMDVGQCNNGRVGIHLSKEVTGSHPSWSSFLLYCNISKLY
jgi:hypothetical protein